MVEPPLPPAQLTTSGAYLIDSNNTLSINTTNNKAVSFGTGNVSIPYASSTALTVSGSAYIGSLNGPLQANNGLVSATTSVGYQYGGTGLTATPSFGQILRGTGSGYALVATSTLGINTNDLTEGNNLFWTNNRFDNRLSATTTLPNLTTLLGLTNATTTGITSTNSWLGTVQSGVWNGTAISNQYGGTGLDSSSLTGIAQIVAGTWSASSTLSAAYGGTGWNSIQANSILLGNGAGRLATTSAGTDGYTLALVSGIPTWVATSTLSTITGTLTVAKGGTGQTSFGQGWLNSDGTTLSASTSPTVNYITATSTSATSTFPYLSVTTNSNVGTVVGGTWQGTAIGATYGGTGATTHTLGNVLVGNGTSAITSTTTANLKATLALNNVENTALTTWAGSTNLTTLGTIGTGVWNGTTIAVANGGTGLTSGYNNTNWDTAYTNRITSATYPLQISSNVISTALGTTTSNTWAGTQTFGAISNTGGYTQSGTTANTFTGTPTFSNATYSALFTGGNVGIGTTDPLRKLQIAGSTASSTDGRLRFSGVGFDNAYYWDIGRQNLNTGDFEFRYGDASAVETVKMLIQLGSGNVGIGTTTPATKLEVVGGHLRVDNSSTQIQFAKSGSQKWSVGSLDGTTDKFHIFEEAGAGSSGYRMTIDTSGNVGIGTAAPSEKIGYW